MTTFTLTHFLVRATARVAFRNDKKIAAKLENFAATEVGSALDMLKAAELVDDGKLRILFMRHAIDEFRHALLFREASRRILADAHAIANKYDLIHATRQNLFEKFGLIQFIAFVYLAEKRGERQFRALAAHFRNDAYLEDLFLKIAKDERFHVSYSKKLLEQLQKTHGRFAIQSALLRVNARRAFEAWRRSGHIFGELLSTLLLAIVYFVVLPPFVLISRKKERAHSGWHKGSSLQSTLQNAQRQF